MYKNYILKTLVFTIYILQTGQKYIKCLSFSFMELDSVQLLSWQPWPRVPLIAHPKPSPHLDTALWKEELRVSKVDVHLARVYITMARICRSVEKKLNFVASDRGRQLSWSIDNIYWISMAHKFISGIGLGGNSPIRVWNIRLICCTKHNSRCYK